MALRQMGQPVDLRAAIPNLQQRLGPNAYDDALRERLRATAGIGQQANDFSAQQAYKQQQAAYQQRLSQLNQQGSNIGPGGPNSTAHPVGNGKWISPVTGKISMGYGAPYSAKNAAVTGSPTHRGIDFGVAQGTPIYSPAAGKLLSDGWGNTGFGNEIRAQFGDGGPYGIFGHLSKFAPNLKPGMAITPGMLLGYSGATGNADGAHLHFETRWDINNPGTAFDPSSWFGW